MGRSNFDWIVVFRDGESTKVECKQTVRDVLDELVNEDDVINIVRLELS
jgi:hypothetical protein